VRGFGLLLLSVAVALTGCSTITSEADAPGAQTEERAEDEPREGSLSPENPFNSEWPTSFTRSEASEAALAAVFPLYESKKEPQIVEPLTVLSESTVPASQVTCATSSANGMLFALEDYLPPRFVEQELFFVIGTTGSWVADTVVQTGANLSNQTSIDGTHTISYHELMLDILQPGVTWGSAEDRVAFFATNLSEDCKHTGYVVAHEVFHMVHMSLDNRSLTDVKPGLDERMAAWFYEGSAEFFSKSIQAFYGESAYSSPTFLKKPGGLEAHSPLDAPVLLYTYGHAAIEYLVANIGVEPVMKVYEKVGEGHTFEEAFGLGIGMPLGQFYQLFDSLEIAPG
jgi:hypothetical protein